MRFYSCIPVALAVAASLGCGTSPPNADRAERAATSSEALLSDDGGTGKGVISLEVAGFTALTCAGAASSAASSQGAGALGNANTETTLNGSIVLHVSVQRRGNGNGPITSVTLDVDSDVSGITLTDVSGASFGVVAFPFAEAQSSANVGTMDRPSAASVMETTVQGKNIESFQSNIMITGMVASAGMGNAAGVALTDDAGAAAAAFALAQASAMLFMNVVVTVSRHNDTSSLIDARVTSITSTCLPSATANAGGDQTQTAQSTVFRSCTSTCTSSSGGPPCTNTCF
jgi:hypothetical protein